MVNKIRRIRDDNITAQDVEDIKKGETGSSSSNSAYLEANNLPNIFRQSSARRFAPLTSQEDRQIQEDLQPLASAIALYQQIDDTDSQDIPMSRFVCMVVELEEAKKSRKL